MRLILLFILFIVISCSTTDDTLYRIDPRTFVENKITLATIADDINYYPLDNTIPFSNYKYIISPNSIYVAAKHIGILKFNRNGKLIKKIGSQGRGPGEFMYGFDFAVDEKTGNVYVLDPGKIRVYTQRGVFLKDISYDKYITSHAMAGSIEIYNSILFLPDFIMEGDSKFNWIFIDTLGNIVSNKKNSVAPFHTKVGRPGSVYWFNYKLFYYNYFNDTIFSINPDLEDIGVYLFAQGDHRWPRSKIEPNSSGQFEKQVKDLFLPIRMIETRKYIILRYYYLQRAAIAFIEKKTKKTFLSIKNNGLLREGETSSFSIKNDLDGGMPLTDFDYYVENDEEYLTTLINPFNLKIYLLSDEYKNTIPKYPEKRNELEKLANSFSETDNPILVYVKLKK
jgi:hypothetical protein